MGRLVVRLSLPNPPVAALELTPLELWQRTVNPDEEDIELSKQPGLQPPRQRGLARARCSV